MARNTYSAGKRQREQAKQRKKKDKAERRRSNMEGGGGDIPIASAEDIQAGAMITPEEAAAQAVDPTVHATPGGEEAAQRVHGVPVRLFVGGLNWRATEADLRAAFEKLGPVNDAIIVTDRDTGDSRGFGFVTMADRRDAAKAVKQLSGTELDGRTIVVKPATERRR